jgi:hypothetical protein
MTSTEKLVNELADRYELAVTEGQKLIRQRWSALFDDTKQAMVGSGYYTARGERQEIESPAGSAPQDDCPRLEYNLGILKLCADAKLPLRTEEGAPIPREAVDQEVLGCCEELLFVRAWHDPTFLRLGLHAVQMHEKAKALRMVGPQVKLSSKLVGTVVSLAFLLLLPAALAVGVFAAVKHDLSLSILAFYIAGGGVLAAMNAAKVGVTEPEFEREYSAWGSFQYWRVTGVVGSGALEHLRQMASKGIRVPSVAFDMADVLRCQMVGQRSSESAAGLRTSLSMGKG